MTAVSPNRRLTGGRPPRIALVCTSTGRGGMERAVQVLARGITESPRAELVGHLIPGREHGPDGRAELQKTLAWYAAGGTPPVAEAGLHGGRGLANLRNLTSALSRLNADVIDLHYTVPLGVSLSDVLAARLAGRGRARPRVVVTVHHPDPWEHATRRRRFMMRTGMRWADRVIATTRHTADLLAAAGKLGPGSVGVAPLGLPDPDARPSREDARRRLGLPGEAFVIGSLCRLVDYKGLLDLADAVNALASAPPTDLGGRPVVWAIGGEGPMEPAIRERSPSRSTRLLGFVDSPADLYAACDVFALPSNCEGFGLVYLEAAQQGRPSIACKLPTVSEVVLDGNTGILVPPGNAVAIDGALRRFAKSGAADELGEQAKRRVDRHFSLAAATRKYLDALPIGIDHIDAYLAPYTSTTALTQ